MSIEAGFPHEEMDRVRQRFGRGRVSYQDRIGLWKTSLALSELQLESIWYLIDAKTPKMGC